MQDTLWLLICAGLVFLMQAGFTCLEAGQVRNKNAINVAMKNMADFIVSGIIFWLIGFAIMFGNSFHGWFGTSLFAFSGNYDDPYQEAFFLYQIMFAATSATIVSGATSERMRFSRYLIVVAFTSGFIYPLIGHWAWAGLFQTKAGWLQEAGFIDFAGSTVVHSVGGWIALAILLIIGPRQGRFDHPTGDNAQRFLGHQLVLSTLGVFLLIFGWLGFNGGSVQTETQLISRVMINTIGGVIGGGLAGLVLSWFLKNRPGPVATMNGLLAGAVAVTANCYAITPQESLIVGFIGGGLAYFSALWLVKLKIDDVVSAVPVHLVAGIWGTLATALFGNLDILGTDLSRGEQFLIQLEGIIIVGFISFSITYIVFSFFNRWFPLRVPVEEEDIGLNVAEHHAKTELFELVMDIENRLKQADYQTPLRVEIHSELGVVAMQYNRVLHAFHQELKAHQSLNQKLEKMANLDGLTSIANRRYFDHKLPEIWYHCQQLQQNLALLLIDADHFKAYNDYYGHQAGDDILKYIAKQLEKAFKEGYHLVARYGGEEFVVVLPETSLQEAENLAQQFIDQLTTLALPHEKSPVKPIVTVSIGLAVIQKPWPKGISPRKLLEHADLLLYEAKKKGRNQFCSIAISEALSQYLSQ